MLKDVLMLAEKKLLVGCKVGYKTENWNVTF